MFAASLILKIVYREQSTSEDNSGSAKKHESVKLLMAIILVAVFGMLLKYFLNNF